MFEMKSASFTVNDRTLLHPTDLRFEQGQVYGLIGHNGSGKSTLLKLLARQQPLSDGEILFDGKPLPDWGNREFARQVAYLPQHLPSAENLLGRELVEMGRYPWRGLLGRMGAEDHRQVDRAIALTHTERFADRLVDTLSGGERGRVWLAMLLAQESRFILLDEPLAALDVAHQVEVLTLVKQLSRQLNLGVIIVIHDINMASRFCDRLVALHSGRLLTHGEPEGLMTSETLHAIYGIPMEVIRYPAHAHPIAIV
ncbi:ATP-binding cassette domain-containing protein [Aeromonas veronii]|uniref:ATP-binding cassette domain-containing protein n=1 Tax=Aeromonas veronii TaxID=654 RepID=UPI00406BEEF9